MQLAIVYNYIPLMIFPIWVALDRVELHLREASKDLGAGRLRTLLQVTLPLAAPGIVAGSSSCSSRCRATTSRRAARRREGEHARRRGVRRSTSRQQDPASGSALAVSLIIAILVVLGVGAAVVWFFRRLLRANRAVRPVVPA